MANIAKVLPLDRRWAAASNLPVMTGKQSHEACSSKQIIQKSFAKGGIAEITGRRSSGRTSLCLHLLAEATKRGEVCAVVDMQDSFHPISAEAAGVALGQLVWVRCKNEAQHALRATDLLLHAGGFGVVLLDLCEASPKALSRIPLSYWYRLRHSVENTPTSLLVCADSSETKGSLINKLALKRKADHWVGATPFLHFEGLEITAISSKTFIVPSECLYISSVA